MTDDITKTVLVTIIAVFAAVGLIAFTGEEVDSYASDVLADVDCNTSCQLDDCADGQSFCPCSVLVSANGDAKVSVSFEMNGHGEAIETKSMETGSLYTFVTPKDDVFAFGGWFFDQELTQKVEDESMVINEDITFYAKWIAPEYNFFLQLDNGEPGLEDCVPVI